MASQPPIQLTILDDSQGEKCEAGCGLDFSLPDVFRSTAEVLSKLYGENVRLEFLDLVEPSVSKANPGIVERVRSGSLSLPILLINGRLRISGYFDIHLLQKALQAHIEIERE